MVRISTAMKIVLALVAIFITIPSIISFSITVADLDRQYCDLKYPEHFRYCMIENGAGIAVQIFRNCAQQVKFYETLDELTNFICKTKSEQEYDKYLKCFVPAMNAEARCDPKFLDIAQKCMFKIASRQ